MSHDIPPVIRRNWSKVDSEATVESVVSNDVSFIRGLGDNGRKVEHTDLTCPHCGHNDTVRLVHVNPEDRDGVSYWCLNPVCEYFVQGELGWATGSDSPTLPRNPKIWSQTAWCPDCEERHTIEVTDFEYDRLDKRDIELEMRTVEKAPIKLCDDCLEARPDRRGGA